MKTLTNLLLNIFSSNISNFYSLKLCMKCEFINQMINNILLLQNLTCTLRTYITCNSNARFSKYEFSKKIIKLCNII